MRRLATIILFAIAISGKAQTIDQVRAELQRQGVPHAVICYNGKVCFGHRPNPKGFNCKNVDTGEMEYLEPMTYDKGGWNIPDIKWWLDVKLPNMEGEQ